MSCCYVACLLDVIAVTVKAAVVAVAIFVAVVVVSFLFYK